MHACQIRELRDRVEKQMEVKLESAEELPPAVATRTAAAAVYNKDGSTTDSDSSAVFNEEASPYPSYSGAAALDHQQQQKTGHYHQTGFTSFLASSFPSIYHGDSHLDQEADFFNAAVAADGFFAEEQNSTGIGSWYGGEGW